MSSRNRWSVTAVSPDFASHFGPVKFIPPKLDIAADCDSKDALGLALRRLFEASQSLSVTVRARGATGESARLFLVRANSPDPGGPAVLVFEDAECAESLRAEQSAGRALLRSAGQPAIVVGEGGYVQDWTSECAACKLLESSPSTSGARIYDLLPPVAAAAHAQQVAEAARTEREVVREIEARSDVFELRVVPLVVRRGAMSRYLLRVRDVTQERLWERRIRETERRFRNITEFASDWVLWITPDKRILYMSPSCERITGRRREEFYADPDLLMEIVHPDDRRVVSKHHQLRSDLPVISSMDFRIVRPDGKHVWISHQCQAIYHNKQYLGVRVANRDITERVHKERLRIDFEARVMEAQRNEGLGVLAGGVAHCFNNFLTAILGNSALALLDLESLAVPADQQSLLHQHRGYLEDIREAAEQASELSQKMLFFSGKGVARLQRVDLSELVRGLGPFLEVPCCRAALHVRVAECLPAISADPDHVRHLILSLATNAGEAIEALPEDQRGRGEVVVATGTARKTFAEMLRLFPGLLTSSEVAPPRAEMEASYVTLSVGDNGVGMDAETRRRCMDPFFSTKFTGRGFGLAVVAGVLRTHRAALHIDSAPDSGSVFTVYFPVPSAAHEAPQGEHRTSHTRGSTDTTAEMARAHAQQAESPPGAPEQRQTLLVVDDDAVVLRITTRMLQHLGFETVEARSAPEAVEVFARHSARIRAALVDIEMPGQSGYALHDELRKARPGLSVVFISGLPREELSERLRRGEKVEFLQKPYTSTSLLDTVRRALSKQ
eukprot:m51a1_g1866 putative pas pac sensor hybrid histidine kinase (785) ;mRNA; r:644350-647705